MRLGDGLWLSTPCDFSGELALDVKALARERGLAAAVTSFNGDYVGYVIPARYYTLDGYEPRTMSFFGPQLPDQFMQVLGDRPLRLRIAGDAVVAPGPRANCRVFMGRELALMVPQLGSSGVIRRRWELT